MRNNMNLLNEAINALKNRPIPSGPPTAVREATLQRLKQAATKGIPAAAENFDLAQEIKTIKLLNKLAVAAAVIILCMIGIAVFKYVSDQDTNQIIVGTPNGDKQPEGTQPTPEVTQKNLLLADELKQAGKLFATRDINGLIKMLSTGQFETKVQVANYLAEIGDERAIEPLKKQSQNWKADPATNPFDAAIKAIQQRLAQG